MCSDPRTAAPAPIMQATAQDAPYEGELIPLEPVHSVAITTICDNTVDILMLDEGPAHRLLGRPGKPPSIAAPTLEEGKVVDSPRAEHGFSAHVAVTKGDRVHRMLFDTGLSPAGCTENPARLDLEASDLEAIVLSHGHFDHTTGLSGLVKTLGRASLPVVIHPEFWSRRRLVIPGREPMNLPHRRGRRGITIGRCPAKPPRLPPPSPSATPSLRGICLDDLFQGV